LASSKRSWMFTIDQRLGCGMRREAGPTGDPTGRADYSDCGTLVYHHPGIHHEPLRKWYHRRKPIQRRTSRLHRDDVSATKFSAHRRIIQRARGETLSDLEANTFSDGWRENTVRQHDHLGGVLRLMNGVSPWYVWRHGFDLVPSAAGIRGHVMQEDLSRFCCLNEHCCDHGKRGINTSFLERQNATDRHHNARKVRKTCTFSKDWGVHEAMTYFTMYSDNFCWPARTLREGDDKGNPSTAACRASLWLRASQMTHWNRGSDEAGISNESTNKHFRVAVSPVVQALWITADAGFLPCVMVI
jgi:hypothetical protein